MTDEGVPGPGATDTFVPEDGGQPSASAPDPDPTEPFEITIHYHNGLVEVFVVTSFAVDQYPGHGILGVKWEQDQAEPGDELIQYIDPTQIQQVTSRSLDRPANRATRRGKK